MGTEGEGAWLTRMVVTLPTFHELMSRSKALVDWNTP